MRLGMVTQWYDPEGGAAAGPGTAARTLRDRGHEVHVLTGYPNYPTGRIFDGYQMRPYMRQVMDGITVHRGPIYPSHDTRAAHRAASYLSFAASGSVLAPFAFRAMDAILVYSTPATAAIPALVNNAAGGAPFAVWVQDLWPDSVTSSTFLKGNSADRAERALHRYCDLIYKRARRVAVTSPGMANRLKDRGVPAQKVEIIPNWAEERNFYPAAQSSLLASELGLTRPFTVMYAGNFGEMQGLEIVIDAAAKLRDLSDVGFALVGGGVVERRLRERVADLGLDNIHFIPPQPFDRMADILALGTVQLISLKDVPLLRITMPSKVQANMAVGKPIIGCLAGDAADLIVRSGSGCVTPPGDAQALSDAIRKMFALSDAEREAMGRRARSHYADHFSEQVVGDRLETMLAEIARARHG